MSDERDDMEKEFEQCAAEEAARAEAEAEVERSIGWVDKKKYPCPFCREKICLFVKNGLIEGTKYAVFCAGCGALGPDASTEEKAIELWNRRRKKDWNRRLGGKND